MNAARNFDPRRDRVTVAAEPYARLGFEPDVIQFMPGFKFVYLDPR